MEIRLLLDTNSIISLLKADQKVIKAIDKADDIFISIISELEFKSFSNLGMRDLKLFQTFVAEIMVISLNTSNILLKEKIVELRTTYKLKLPDAIIAATAITNNAILITGDKGFKKVKELQLDLIL